MRHVPNYGDTPTLAFCAFCGGRTGTKDHCPSKVFLDEPLSTNLFLVAACRVHGALAILARAVGDSLVNGQGDRLGLGWTALRTVLGIDRADPLDLATISMARALLGGASVRMVVPF